MRKLEAGPCQNAANSSPTCAARVILLRIEFCVFGQDQVFDVSELRGSDWLCRLFRIQSRVRVTRTVSPSGSESSPFSVGRLSINLNHILCTALRLSNAGEPSDFCARRRSRSAPGRCYAVEPLDWEPSNGRTLEALAVHQEMTFATANSAPGTANSRQARPAMFRRQ